jgi:hypothetical protein
MESMQSAILGKLEAALATSEKLAVRRQASWDNIGQLYVQDDLHTVLQVAYDFQDTYCSITALGVDRDEVPEWFEIPRDAVLRRRGKPSVEWIHLDYGDGERLSRMLRALSYVVKNHHLEYLLSTREDENSEGPDGGPVTVQALLDDWSDRPGLTEEAKLALLALPQEKLAEAIRAAFGQYEGMWLHVLDNTRGDATRALLAELGYEEEF